MSSTSNLRVLIVAEHASLQYGGEAALPLHYFRVLRQRGIETWLIVHERTREELMAYFPEDRDRLYFVRDSLWHKLLWQLGKPLPHRLSLFTFGFLLRLLTQYMQRQMIRRLACQNKATLVHQPIPVSPKEPSMIYDVGVPVVIGPMNGGMHYPPGFKNLEHPLEHVALGLGRMMVNGLNRLIPGKLKASALLVANDRTQAALPRGVSGMVRYLPENGVDLAVFHRSSVLSCLDPWIGPPYAQHKPQLPIQFIYIGRLVDWKAVNLLLLAFSRVAPSLPMTLEIIGDGPERPALEAQAQQLGLMAVNDTLSTWPAASSASSLRKMVQFSGWLPQAHCADRLANADVMVLPSLMECGGAVVLEAMAVGVPVIATDWGGLADYLTPESGILVTPTSRDQFVDDLAIAMTRLALNPTLRTTMGQAGQRRVLEHFDWDAKVSQMIDIYHEVLKDDSKCPIPASDPVNTPSNPRSPLYHQKENTPHRQLPMRP